MKRYVVLQKLLFRELIEEAKPRPLKYVVFLARVRGERQRKKLRSGVVKEYTVYRITIPREVVEKLSLEPEVEELVLVRLAKPRWYHLLNYSDRDIVETLWEKLPLWTKLELCSNNLAPEKLCSQYYTVTLVLTKQEIQKLGINPDKPITLEELKNKLQKQ